MAAEFEAAEEDGRPLRFALGCLIGAWRMMPAHAEGRLVLAGYALSLGVFIPVAAMLALATASGFPFFAASEGVGGYLWGSGAHVLLLNDGNLVAAPSLTLLMMAMAALHLPLAWWMLDGDWDRVAATNRFGAATVATLAIVTSLSALDPSRLLLPIAVLAAEIGMLRALTRWHQRLRRDDASYAFDITS
ncbi:MAG: hypothetical protein EOP60_06970 [Sphingomonadales bacterium]|nr:MAG: hypothetical protein EOP60_06970 [Sphingomonadales bacterium]